MAILIVFTTKCCVILHSMRISAESKKLSILQIDFVEFHHYVHPCEICDTIPDF